MVELDLRHGRRCAGRRSLDATIAIEASLTVPGSGCRTAEVPHVNANELARIAALVGEPARAAMLVVLMDGRALTAAELAGAAGVAPQTASSHLARLTEAGLLKVERQGRHRYHRLADPEVARMLEGILQLAATTARARPATGPRDAAMRTARTCYDHLAGRLGVAITDALVAHGAVEFDDEAGLLTAEGVRFLGRIGIAVPTDGRASRPMCRPCLDWSERRPHVAGKVGAAICAHCLAAGWVRRRAGTRSLEITPPGRRALHGAFGIAALA
ncbi:MAG: helix-turn-helix transcriptional regulator [Alphaproteobacteria bacterium]|nr:helix-turn-helix transcriptional regulator [Alphaproteobacteria bacterium]